MTALPLLMSTASPLGPSLRRWRVLRRVKQAHAAGLLGVSQATISRWESGAQTPDADEERRLRLLMAARLDSAADRQLARMVSLSSAPVHLVCDLTHRLLAASPAREREFAVPLSDLLGHSLWRYASPDIVNAEARLGELGWFGPEAPAVELATGANAADAPVPITPSRFRWVRFQLSDGSFARLTETLSVNTAAG